MVKRRLRQAYTIHNDGFIGLLEVIDNNGIICDVYGYPMLDMGASTKSRHTGVLKTYAQYKDKHGVDILVIMDPLPPMDSIMIQDTSDVTEFEKALEAYEQENEGE